MVLDLINQRASIRNFSDRVISEEDMTTILESARLAPSWMNAQPWHFISIKDNLTKELVSKLANGQKQIKDASHIVFVLGDLSAWDESRFKKILEKKDGITEDVIQKIFSNPGLYPKLQGEEKLILRTIEQTTYAMAYMILQAQALGIDSCIIGAFGNELTGFNQDLYNQLREKLHIPDRHLMLGLLALGYRQDGIKTPKKIRKDFDEVVSKEIYDIKN